MKKYKGSLKGADFNRELTKSMQNDITRNYYICCTCHHVNGECEEFARRGTCKAYDEYADKIKNVM